VWTRGRRGGGVSAGVAIIQGQRSTNSESGPDYKRKVTARKESRGLTEEKISKGAKFLKRRVSRTTAVTLIKKGKKEG